MPSSPDSSSDSSGSPPAASEGPNIETERCLPGVVRLDSSHSSQLGLFNLGTDLVVALVPIICSRYTSSQNMFFSRIWSDNDTTPHDTMSFDFSDFNEIARIYRIKARINITTTT